MRVLVRYFYDENRHFNKEQIIIFYNHLVKIKQRIIVYLTIINNY